MAGLEIGIVFIPGIRALSGRFARMADRGLVELQTANAEALAAEVEGIFRAAAPHGGRGESESFAGGLRAELTAEAKGFTISLTTNQPNLRRWLREGTGIYGPTHERIYPRQATVLAFHWPNAPAGITPGKDGRYYFRSIAGMPANDWEDRARELAAPLLVRLGNRIGVETVVKLAQRV